MTAIAVIDWFVRIPAVLLAVEIVRGVVSKNRALMVFVRTLAVCLAFAVVMLFVSHLTTHQCVPVHLDSKAIPTSCALKHRHSVSKIVNVFWDRSAKILSVYPDVVSTTTATKTGPAFTEFAKTLVYCLIVVE